MVISNYHGMGGHDIVINNLCSGLNKIGYNTAIGAFSFAQNPPDNIQKINLSRLRGLSSNGLHFDIIHNHQTLMNYYSLLSSKPFVYHYHGISDRKQAINLKMSMLLCRNRISKIIAVSYAGLDQLRNVVGNISADVIYNGVDTNYYHTNLPQPYKKGDPQLLFVGNLYPHKNVIKIIDVMPQIKELYPAAHLQIVGDGEDYQRLYHEIKRRKLPNSVDLVGKVSQDELRLRYSSCDMYISASRREAYPVPTMEAMACGKPLILSDIPPHKEILDASKAGLIFSLENSDICDKVQEVYEKRRFFGLAGRKYSEMHDLSNVCNQIADIYHRIMTLDRN